MAILQKPQLSI